MWSSSFQRSDLMSFLGRREVLTVQPHPVGRAAVAGEAAQVIYETNEQVAEGEFERPEEEPGHVHPVALTSRPVATGGQFITDLELFGSTVHAGLRRLRTT